MTCGGGEGTASRHCTKDGTIMVDNSFCPPGDDVQVINCNDFACPEAPENPAVEDESDDTPTTQASATTSTQPPPVGEWNSWENWSSCSRSCDGGTRKRGRTALVYFDHDNNFITSPLTPQFEFFHGDYEYEVESCNISSCGQCVYENWSAWTDCSDKCATATASRQRKCVCGGVASYCSGDGEFDGSNDNPLEMNYAQVQDQHYQHASAYCSEFTHSNNCAEYNQDDEPLLQSVSITFISYIMKPVADAGIYFNDNDYTSPADPDRWVGLFNAVQKYLHYYLYLDGSFNYKIDSFTHEPASDFMTNFGMSMATEVAIAVRSVITFNSNPDENTETIDEFVASLNKVYNRFPKLSDYNNRRSMLIGRRRRQATGDEIASAASTQITGSQFFQRSGTSSTLSTGLNEITSIVPTTAIYQMMSLFAADSSVSSNFAINGCHCMKFGAHPESVLRELGGAEHINDLDEQCHRFFGQTRCAFLAGGKCENFPQRKKLPYIVEYDSAISQLKCDSVGTWQSDASADEIECLNDLCLIHNYYYQGITDFIASNGGVVIPDPGVDVNTGLTQCSHPGNAVSVTCTGDAPHLRFVKQP